MYVHVLHQAEYCEEEGVVRVSWQPVEVAGGDEVEYIVNSWKDGAGDPVTIYRYFTPLPYMVVPLFVGACRGQLTNCMVTTEMLCRGHTHQIAVCASASGETGEHSQREAN